MAKIDLPHVQRFKDRHGHVRHYFRRPGYKRATLPGEVGSAPFMDAYRAALEATDKRSAGAAAVKPGSVSALLVAYYGSSEFKALKLSTQANYRNILERFRTEHGDKPVGRLERPHIDKIMDARSDTPGAARNFLKRLRVLLDFAVDRGWRNDNPARAVKAPRSATEGFRAWDDADIAQFEQHWPTGSRARLALALLLYTGQRRSDVVSMGWQHVRDGKIHVTQIKRGQGQRPVRLAIKLHPTLAAALESTPRDNLTFLMTAYGKPMTMAGFTNWFVRCAVEAGLPAKSSPHGLRKAAARRLAEAGCTAKQIAAITGHRTLSEVAHYTDSADQERLADAAILAISDRR